MITDNQSVVYAHWANELHKFVSSNGKEYAFGDDTVLLAYEDGELVAVDNKDFRLSGSMQLTEVSQGSLSGLHLLRGGRSELISETADEVLLKSVVDGSEKRISPREYAVSFKQALSAAPTNLEESKILADQAIDLVQSKQLIATATKARHDWSIFSAESEGLLA